MLFFFFTGIIIILKAILCYEVIWEGIHMKKALCLLFVSVLLCTTLIDNVFAIEEKEKSDSKYVFSDNPFEIKNEEAKHKYFEFTNKKLRLDSVVKEQGDFKELSNSDTIDNQSVDGFEKLAKISDGNFEMEELYTYNDENVVDVITYDKTDNSYILIENDLVNNTVNMTVNNQTYILEENQGNMYFLSQNGEKLIFSKKTGEEVVRMNENEELSNKSRVTATKWIKLSGTLHRTNIFDLLIISVIAGAVGTVMQFSSVALGVIYNIAQIGLTVGSYYKQEIHIAFTQYYASDCNSYIKEENLYYAEYDSVSKKFLHQYYQDKELKKPVATTSFFHSIRPENTGNNACMAYR